jgi:predicted RNA methylase
MNEKLLTKTLQELASFSQSKPALEQYCTPPALAARVLLEQQEFISDKTILDLGAGTGVLGIGALLVGAKHVTFGTRNKNIDSRFLEYACAHATTIITMHKTSTKQHIRTMAERLGKKILSEEDVEFPLTYTMDHHKKPRENIAVTLFVLQ